MLFIVRKDGIKLGCFNLSPRSTEQEIEISSAFQSENTLLEILIVRYYIIYRFSLSSILSTLRSSEIAHSDVFNPFGQLVVVAVQCLLKLINARTNAIHPESTSNANTIHNLIWKKKTKSLSKNWTELMDQGFCKNMHTLTQRQVVKIDWRSGTQRLHSLKLTIVLAIDVK